MDKEDIKKRTKKLAIRIIEFCDSLPRQTKYFIIEKQLIRAATSVGINYRAGYQPDMQKLATETVLKQAELIANELTQGVSVA